MEDYQSWKLDMVSFYIAYGIANKDQQILLLRGCNVLPKDTEVETSGARTIGDFCSRLQREVHRSRRPHGYQAEDLIDAAPKLVKLLYVLQNSELRT